jgi:hypothetical protein
MPQFARATAATGWTAVRPRPDRGGIDARAGIDARDRIDARGR